MKSSLIINSTDINGNKKQKAISNINPNATSAQLKEFAQRFTALSTNSYDSANVVDTFNVDAEQRISGGGAYQRLKLLYPSKSQSQLKSLCLAKPLPLPVIPSL